LLIVFTLKFTTPPEQIVVLSAAIDTAGVNCGFTVITSALLVAVVGLAQLAVLVNTTS
jgi:hypothetical protein